MVDCRKCKTRSGLKSLINYNSNISISNFCLPGGESYQIEYGLWGNPTEVVNPLGISTIVDYEAPFHQMSALVDERGNRTTFEYDNQGNMTSLTYPDGLEETIQYDPVGNPITFTDRKGTEIQYTYDARGQLLRKDYPDGSWAAYTYDAAGNMLTAADANGAILMEYDPLTDLLTKITYPTGYYYSYTYNSVGQRTLRVDQDGHELNYDYDWVGRLVRLYDETGFTYIQYEYDLLGRLSRENKGNGTYTTYAYDSAWQITSIVNFAPDHSIQSRFDYSYDANGNPVSMTTLEGTTSYTYDSIGQLVGVTYPNGDSTQYEYDPAGNRIKVTENGKPVYYSTNNMNQYIHAGDYVYEYDDNGNLISNTLGLKHILIYPSPEMPKIQYEYDYEDRLVRVLHPNGDTWEYTYDALGNRIEVVFNGISKKFIHDPIGLYFEATELDSEENIVSRYIYGIGLAARIDENGSDYYFNYDLTGNTRQLTNSSSNLTNIYSFSAFGEPDRIQEAVPNEYLFNGRFGVTDDGNGLIYMRARYYLPEIGRFNSLDLMNFKLFSINRYSYTKNSPIRYTDPLGLIEQEWREALNKIEELIQKVKI